MSSKNIIQGVIHRDRNENLIFYPAYSKAKISSVILRQYGGK
ncbi:hypothetical protein CSB67_4282 [Enterobacter hormaechei]|nr:hypothetical protein CSB67_4282 [Enterobacter hormaechei]